MNKLMCAVFALSGLLVAGCANDDMLRTEGLTLGAGDAMATNTALQVIDPWPAGVENTDFPVPSQRAPVKAEDKAATTASTTTTATPSP